jgi:hypothetical protein
MAPPNVRLAESEAERRALARRLRDAEISTRARNCNDVLERFGVAVLSSRAVMARSLGKRFGQSLLQDRPLVAAVSKEFLQKRVHAEQG